MVDKGDIWRATDLNIDGYMGVYFIVMCIQPMCSENTSESF